jgi:hypothetical protein
LEIDFNGRWTAGPNVGQFRAEVGVAQNHAQSGTAGVEIDHTDQTVPTPNLDLALIEHYHAHVIVRPGRVTLRFDHPQFWDPFLGVGPFAVLCLWPKPVLHIVETRATYEFQKLSKSVLALFAPPEKSAALQPFALRRSHGRIELSVDPGVSVFSVVTRIPIRRRLVTDVARAILAQEAAIRVKAPRQPDYLRFGSLSFVHLASSHGPP